MELDQLLNLCSVVCSKALPIAGFVALIFLCMFLKRLATVMKKANESVDKVNQTLDIVTKELEQLQGPLKTLGELSETVDYVHEASKNAVQSALVTVISNLGKIKEALFKILKKDTTDIDEIVEDILANENEDGGDTNDSKQ